MTTPVTRLSQWLDHHIERTDQRHTLAAVGLTAADIKQLERAGLNPIGTDHTPVRTAAQLGLTVDEIPAHVSAVRHLTRALPYLGTTKASDLIARLTVSWGMPPQYAATLINDIAHATEETS